MIDDTPIRGTKLLSDVYQRCNIAVCEPANFEEAKMDQNWITAMKEELFMIERNKTWELVDRPQNRKVIGVKWCIELSLMLMAKSISIRPDSWSKDMLKYLVWITQIPSHQ